MLPARVVTLIIVFRNIYQIFREITFLKLMLKAGFEHADFSALA